MGDITSFRIARAPQRTPVNENYHIHIPHTPIFDQWVVNMEANEPNKIQESLEADGAILSLREFDHSHDFIKPLLIQVRWLDNVLLSHDNKVAWGNIRDEFQKNFEKDPIERINSREWGILTSTLSTALVAVTVFLKNATPDLRADIYRLLLVMGCVELAAKNNLPDEKAVYEALRWRNIILPSMFNLWTHSILTRSPAFSDLYNVREEWNRYEVGEIAHIENVLKGEVKTSLFERTDVQETTTTTDQDVTHITERDSQSTDRFELKDDAQRDTSLAAHIDGKGDTSGQYGPTHVDSHIGGTFDYSTKEATQRAVTQARETVARAVSKAEEHVRTQRIQRTLTTVHTKDRHALDNTGGADNVAGIYRWINKIQTVQVFKYPHRMLFEFEVPEPGAFIRWLKSKHNLSSQPEPLTLNGQKIIADMIVPSPSGDANHIYYLDLASKYSVQGLTLPPLTKKVFANIPTGDLSQKPSTFSNFQAVIPEGYEAWAADVYVIMEDAIPEKDENKNTGYVEVYVGIDAPHMDDGSLWRFQGKGIARSTRQFDFQQPVSGAVPIQVTCVDVNKYDCVIEFYCRPDKNTITKWQLDTFDLIQGAYWELQRQWEQAQAQSAIQAGISISGDSPTRNAEVVREELKRSVTELLLGDRFKGKHALTYDNDPNSFPRTDFNKNVEASEIQFIEQAFEWENLSYILYPYYWADSQEWATLQQIEGPDAKFDRFLRSGSARVVLPARPGFACAAQTYTQFGTLWGGESTPIPGDNLYLSIAKEIRAQQQPPEDGEPCDHWEVRLPTTLVYLSPIDTTLPLENVDAELPKN